ncbi:hypothetical protein LTR03_005109 [Friedmanniomyces endolithicus]|nr:hypothetical protein LTR03_005109 [Friedmanniomyces endolithicus]
MSLRLGFDYCMAHVSESLVKEEFQSVKNNTSKTTIVFYDFQLTKDGQIERLAAITESGEKFSANLKTAPTSDKPPPARKKYSLASYIFTQHPMSPSLAIERFTTWIKDRHRVNAEGDEDVSNVVLAAHYGSCHHHVYLLRLMSNCDITPPPYRICDTLAIFKMLKGLAVEVTLPALVVRYTAWLRHVYHDPDSDVNALRAVMTAAFPDVRRVCLAFSCSYEFFAKATGLDRYESAIAGFRKRGPLQNSCLRRRSLEETREPRIDGIDAGDVSDLEGAMATLDLSPSVMDNFLRICNKTGISLKKAPAGTHPSCNLTNLTNSNEYKVMELITRPASV